MQEKLLTKKRNILTALESLNAQKKYIESQIIAHSGALEVLDQLIQEMSEEQTTGSEGVDNTGNSC